MASEQLNPENEDSEEISKKSKELAASDKTLKEIFEERAKNNKSGEFKEEKTESLQGLQETKKKPELLPEILPVFIYRWFRNGCGWAYNPSVIDILNTSYVVDEALKYSDYGKFKKKVSGDNVWLIYTKRPDYNPKDPLAKGRNPFYFTATIIYGNEPTDEKLDEIYRQLESIPEIESEGDSPELIIGGKK